MAGTGVSLGRTAAGTLRRMALVRPFRALRYDEAKAGPLDTLVAPPYDVIGAEEREALRARSPYNVVNLTLPDSEEEAGRTFRSWREEGVLAEEPEGFWALSQEYVGPDGVARTRTGLAVSLRVEPYETRVVLPHERTHRGPKEGRLRLLRAVRAQLEPIFLLYDADPPFAVPEREPDLAVDGNALWKLGGSEPLSPFFADLQLLIADGHHRYETALAFHEEEGTEESAWMLVVLVSTRDPGLTIFPTHRVFPDERLLSPDGSGAEPEAALRQLDSAPVARAAAVQVTRGGASIVEGEEGALDVQLVDRLGHEGIAYTPDWREAVRRVEEGEAGVAYLVRPPRIEQVFAASARGEVMPQKTTYFYPKLLSGLLFHPL
jgi:uncharacterized protein (DUF1015 family)